MESNKSKWIALDGIDAAGKSTQVVRVADVLEASYHLKVAKLGEFSISPVGDLIREIIKKNRFFSLDVCSPTPIAESILLLADLCFQAEHELSKKGEADVIISDRGLVSFIAYQALRIAKENRKVDEIIEILCKAIGLFFSDLKQPDLNVIYELELETINKRMQERGEAPLEKDEMEFLGNAQAVLHQVLGRFPNAIIIVDGQTISSITKQTVDAISKTLGLKQK